MVLNDRNGFTKNVPIEFFEFRILFLSKINSQVKNKLVFMSQTIRNATKNSSETFLQPEEAANYFLFFLWTKFFLHGKIFLRIIFGQTRRNVFRIDNSDGIMNASRLIGTVYQEGL